MAKFLKSIFHSNERKTLSYDGTVSSEDDHKTTDVSPSMEVRRKLSISRSGRMRQAQKKRLSLSMDLYGEDADFQQADKRKVREYHVSQKTPARDNPLTLPSQRRRSGDSLDSTESGKVFRGDGANSTVIKTKEVLGDGSNATVIPNTKEKDVFTPEEEIDSAFEVIDKTL